PSLPAEAGAAGRTCPAPGRRWWSAWHNRRSPAPDPRSSDRWSVGSPNRARSSPRDLDTGNRTIFDSPPFPLRLELGHQLDEARMGPEGIEERVPGEHQIVGEPTLRGLAQQANRGLLISEQSLDARLGVGPMVPVGGALRAAALVDGPDEPPDFVGGASGRGQNQSPSLTPELVPRRVCTAESLVDAANADRGVGGDGNRFLLGEPLVGSRGGLGPPA